MDVAVIGGGPGGYYAAMHASKLGAKVVLVEKDEIGGTCLNRGCIPTLFLQRIAKALSQKSNLERMGLVTSSHLDYEAMMHRMKGLIRELARGMEVSLKREDVMLIRGTATFIEPRLIEVYRGDGSRMEVAYENAIIATGAKPDMKGLEKYGRHVLTTDQVFELDELPRSLAVVGEDAVGITLAAIFHELGVNVTVIGAEDRMLPEEDEELSILLQDFMNAKDIDTIMNAKIEAVDGADDHKVIRLLTEKGEREVRVEKVLLCHRMPNTEGLGLERIDVKTQGNSILVDERMETSVPGIYAVGDAVGGSMLAAVASKEGLVAAENAAGGRSKMNYKAIPHSIYSIPELASVGLTEEKARELGYKVGVARSFMARNSFAKITGETEGKVKIVFDEASQEILGLHILGSEAFEVINGFTMAIGLEATVEELYRTIYIHPSRAEVIGDASRKIQY